MIASYAAAQKLSGVMARIRSSGRPRSWLYTILTTLNRNRLRSLSRRPMISSLEDNDAPDLAGPEGRLDRIFRRRRRTKLRLP